MSVITYKLTTIIEFVHYKKEFKQNLIFVQYIIIYIYRTHVDCLPTKNIAGSNNLYMCSV